MRTAYLTPILMLLFVLSIADDAPCGRVYTGGYEHFNYDDNIVAMYALIDVHRDTRVDTNQVFCYVGFGSREIEYSPGVPTSCVQAGWYKTEDGTVRSYWEKWDQDGPLQNSRSLTIYTTQISWAISYHPASPTMGAHVSYIQDGNLQLSSTYYFKGYEKYRICEAYYTAEMADSPYDHTPGTTTNPCRIGDIILSVRDRDGFFETDISASPCAGVPPADPYGYVSFSGNSVSVWDLRNQQAQ